MKKLILFSMIVLSVTVLFAQSPVLNWVKTYHGNEYSVDSSSVMKVYDADKSIYIGVTSDAFGTANDILLVKRNGTTGDTIWTRRYNGPANGDDQFVEMDIDQTTGDVYLTGKSSGIGTGYDIVVLKFSFNGNLVWMRRFNNSYKNKDDVPIDIGIASSGRIIIVGNSTDRYNNNPSGLMLCYDLQGTLLADEYIEYYSGNVSNTSVFKYSTIKKDGYSFVSGDIIYGDYDNGYSLPGFWITQEYHNWYSGGFNKIIDKEFMPPRNGVWNGVSNPNDFNYMNAMCLDNANNVYLATVMDTLPYSDKYFNMVFYKLNSSGDILWQNRIREGNNDYGNIRVKALKVDANNLNIYASGYLLNSGGNLDWFLIKYNNSGELQWKITKNGENNGNDIPYNIAFDNMQNPIVVGTTKSTGNKDQITFAKFNKITGAEMFSENFAAENMDSKAFNIIVDDKNYILINGVQKDLYQSQSLTLRYCSPVADAGVIAGKASVCQGEQNITYSVPTIANATSYIWSLPSAYTGTSNTNSITVNLSIDAKNGDISVKGHNDCGDGKESKLSITIIPSTIPVVATSTIDSITFSTVKCSGVITDEGCAIITSRGFCWSTSENPTIADSKISVSTSTSEFSGQITGLVPGKTYFVRAYAINFKGTGYGGQKIISTRSAEEWNTIADYDGNNYSTVTIGTQVWMGENLKTTSYNNGIPIPLITNNTTWKNSISPAYCWYNNDISKKSLYGALYNWYTVNTEKLCPAGWHVPSYEDWMELEDYLISNGYNYDGTTSGNKVAKSLASSFGWNYSSNIGAIGNSDFTQKINITGFSAIPAGGRRGDNGATDYAMESAGWWSSSIKESSYVWAFSMKNYSVDLNAGGYSKMLGQSIRCLRDEPVSSIPADAGAISGKAAVCNGATDETYTVPKIAGAASYIWTLPSGENVFTTKNSLDVSFQNFYDSGVISVKGQNDFGYGGSSEFQFSIIPSPTIFAGNDTTICEGSAIKLKATGGNSYNWNNGVEQNVEFIPTETKEYTVTGSNGICSNTDNIVVTVKAKPEAPQIYQSSNTLFSTVSIGNKWYFNGDFTYLGNTNSFNPEKNGVYYATVIQNSCESSPSNQINFTKTAIENIESSGLFKIYPNPTTGIFKLEFNNANHAKEIHIYDSTGRLVKNTETQSNIIEINMTNNSKGIYLLKVAINGVNYSSKIELK